MNTVASRLPRRPLACLIAAIVLSATRVVEAAPAAFPGAEGWGRQARGGRDAGARILFVTSLDDSGPGTLRDALLQKGPRIVLFKTGGVIALQDRISIQNGQLTVAGQTAPGDGIIVRNHPIRIGASDVIVRGLRIRNGDGPGPRGDLRDSIQIGNAGGKPVHDIVVDHCSFGWSVDETVEFWYPAHDVTLSYNIISEALWKSIHKKGSHGYALLFGHGPHDRVTVHHNLFAHNERRNPWIKDDSRVEFVNNVVYNWGTEATGLWNTEKGKKPSFANLIGNVYKGGPDCAKRIAQGKKTLDLGRPAATGTKFYLRDNLGPGRTDAAQDDWDIVALGDQEPALYRADKPIADLVSGVAPQSASDAVESVLRKAGALPRDAADQRAVADTRNATGQHLDNLDQIGGYPAYAAGEYPADRDNDGLPDAWETAHGLNPADASDALASAADGSGYLNVERYINSLIP